MVNAFVEKSKYMKRGSITVRLVYDDMLEELRKYAKNGRLSYASNRMYRCLYQTFVGG